MTAEEAKRIYSNEFADLIVEFAGNEPSFKQYPNATFQSLVHTEPAEGHGHVTYVMRIPINELSNQTISQLGYTAMPALLGIISESAAEASGITRIRTIPKLNLRGEGVLIGIVDTGIDYTNPIFLKADGTTKISLLWDQAIYGEDYQSNTFYGTEYTGEQINLALKSPNPYDIVPSRDENGHGTMLAGIIAGNEVPEQGFTGIVPDAELVVVKLKPPKQYLREFWKVPENAVCFQENDISLALEYLELTANRLGKPMSICLALGTSLDSHDSKSYLSRWVSIRAENYNFSIQTAAGNEGSAKRHFFGSINPSKGFETVELRVGENEGDFSMELWGDSPGLFSMDIKTPSGEYIPRIIPKINEARLASFIFEQTKINIDNQIVESGSGDQLILLRFTKPAPGIWVFRVYGKGDLSLSFHIWLPMEGFISNDTYFLRPDPNTTLLSLGNSTEAITVTAYNHEDRSLYLNASKGYTRTGFIKPDLAAPGVNILSPDLSHGFAAVSGTSPAAAHTSGVAAMLLEWGIVKGNFPFMKTADIKILMIRGANREPELVYPNKDWGYGILDVYNIFNSLREGL